MYGRTRERVEKRTNACQELTRFNKSVTDIRPHKFSSKQSSDFSFFALVLSLFAKCARKYIKYTRLLLLLLLPSALYFIWQKVPYPLRTCLPGLFCLFVAFFIHSLRIFISFHILHYIFVCFGVSFLLVHFMCVRFARHSTIPGDVRLYTSSNKRFQHDFVSFFCLFFFAHR